MILTLHLFIKVWDENWDLYHGIIKAEVIKHVDTVRRHNGFDPYLAEVFLWFSRRVKFGSV